VEDLEAQNGSLGLWQLCEGTRWGSSSLLATWEPILVGLFCFDVGFVIELFLFPLQRVPLRARNASKIPAMLLLIKSARQIPLLLLLLQMSLHLCHLHHLLHRWKQWKQ
jgi:hypothetical protein